jgi:hypothetical protein
LREAEGLDEYELGLFLAVLIKRMQNAAERNLRRAYKIGLGSRPLTEEDENNIRIALEQNLFYLENSLAPAIRERIQVGLDTEESLTDAIRASADFSLSRATLYGGAFWALAWIGVGAALEKVFGNQAKNEVPVRRILDPSAQHCSTCPPKAREYSSWNEMLAYCGGLPADGSDDCHSNCRCTIEVYSDGHWVSVI